MPVREQIGRFKIYWKTAGEYQKVWTAGSSDCRTSGERRACKMPKEYRTIQEVAGPLMLVRGVEGMYI